MGEGGFYESSAQRSCKQEKKKKNSKISRTVMVTKGYCNSYEVIGEIGEV